MWFLHWVCIWVLKRGMDMVVKERGGVWVFKKDGYGRMDVGGWIWVLQKIVCECQREMDVDDEGGLDMGA